jgi:aldehyde:ferredoxin oxidoreductase
MSLTACGSCPVACAVSLAFADGSIPPGSVRCADFGRWAISESLYSKRKELWGRVAHEASRTCDFLGINVYEFCDKWFLQAIQAGLLTEEDTGLPLAQYGSRQFWQTHLPLVASNQGVGVRLARGGADFLRRMAQDAPEEGIRAAARRLYAINWNKDGTINYMAEGGKFEPEYASVLHVVLDGLGETDHRAMAYQTYNPALFHTAPLFPYGTPEFYQLRDRVAEKIWRVNHLEQRETWSLRFVEWCLNENILCNSLELCAWTFPLLYSAYTEDHQGDPTLPARFLSAITGWEITIDELHRTVAPRIAALERMIRCREGRTADDDIFQEEVFKLPWVQGWLTKEKARAFMSDFYAIRGWQRDCGIPERATLERLGLEDTVIALESLAGGKAKPGVKD